MKNQWSCDMLISDELRLKILKTVVGEHINVHGART